MPSRFLAATVASLLFALIGCNHTKAPAQVAQTPTLTGEPAMKVTGPFTQDNLSVYLIHGPNRVANAKYLTLQEAMDQKKAIVHETGNVNELAIENLADDDLYIQSGEIVKGGKQDRTIGTDMIITRAMGKTPIASFCVEHGRWQPRGEEGAAAFATADGYVAGKAMKLVSNSNNHDADQSAVWQSVSDNQRSLSRSVSADVRGGASPSSFQLTLENPKLNEKLDKYMNALATAPANQSDVIGWAYAVNGKLSGANVYANAALFQKLWPKLIKSGSIEALSELEQAKSGSAAPGVEEVNKFLAASESGTAKQNKINDRTLVESYDCADSILLETCDPSSSPVRKDQWIHRNYMTKETKAR